MLDLAKLENIRRTGERITARCPACHEAGGDRTGNHLACWPDTGKFACAAHPGDKPHRQRIWALAGLPSGEPKRKRPPQPGRQEVLRRRAAVEEARHRAAVAAAARREADRIFTAFDWHPDDITRASPARPAGTAPAWHNLFTLLYPPDAVLWAGRITDSGEGRGHHFQTRAQWLAAHPHAAAPPHPFTCPDTFLPGSFSRCGANVSDSPYLVVEADEALGHKPGTDAERAENLRRNLCILRWLREELRWSLHAIVHTGGKSCHGWFLRPPEPHLAELKALAPALGIDRSVFEKAHPVRLPGVPHEKTGGRSRLLYLAAAPPFPC